MRPQPIWRATMFGVLALSLVLLAQAVNAQRTPATHTIFMNVVEFKGSTTTDKLAPPPVNPGTLSKGYAYRAPGEADKAAPQKWELDSYAFTPGFVTVLQGDTVTFTAFVVNGNEHQVAMLAPDGQVVVPPAKWERAREYRVSFVAETVGTYRLTCTIHAPTMTANVLVMPR